MSSDLQEGRELLGGAIRLTAAALVVGAFFVPFLGLPFGQALSLFDLLRGALGRGGWPAPRVALLVVFVAALAFPGVSVSRVLRAKHESVV